LNIQYLKIFILYKIKGKLTLQSGPGYAFIVTNNHYKINGT